MQETQVQSLGQEDPLEKEMATHSSIFAWGNPMDRGAWWATVHGVTESDMIEGALLLKIATKGQGDNDKEPSVHNPSP